MFPKKLIFSNTLPQCFTMNLRPDTMRGEMLLEFTVSFSTTVLVLLTALLILANYYTRQYEQMGDTIETFLGLPPLVVVVKDGESSFT